MARFTINSGRKFNKAAFIIVASLLVVLGVLYVLVTRASGGRAFDIQSASCKAKDPAQAAIAVTGDLESRYCLGGHTINAYLTDTHLDLYVPSYFNSKLANVYVYNGSIRNYVPVFSQPKELFCGGGNCLLHDIDIAKIKAAAGQLPTQPPISISIHVELIGTNGIYKSSDRLLYIVRR